ncbi:MAG: cation transporter [Acidimicrobiia bacterium]|nr:cation transporter [Actinomycetota bacterium]MBL6925243.1 cation transporter [Acidimicrobiia bacterium]MBL6926511.1 cation transporter [Acidimicrobiia bacterium]
MAEGHGHANAHGGAGTVLRWALAANGVLLVVQAVGAVVFGSLALLADTVHQGSDVFALVVASVAVSLSARAPSDRYSFGLRRAEVMAALLNAVLLVAAAGWIIVEAARRLPDPPEMSGWGVFTVAVVGLLVNGGSAWMLQRSGDKSLNVSGAALHLLSDAAGSFGVLVAGLAVVFWDATWVDPAVSFLIAGLVLWTGVGLVRRTTHILLEGTPSGVDPAELSAVMSAHGSVDDVHHLHTWAVDSTMVALSAHVVVAADSLHDAQLVGAELERLLVGQGVAHVTLALECHPCGEDAPVEA